MKKIILIFTCIISSLIFYFYYDISNYQIFFKTMQYFCYVDNSQLNAIEISQISNNKEVLKGLLKTAKQTKTSICYNTSDKFKDGENMQQMYIYTPKKELSVCLKDDSKIINFSQDNYTHYYSSYTLDDNKYNLLTSFNHKYFNSYESQIYIYPFVQSFNHEIDTMTLYVYSDNIENFEIKLKENINDHVQYKWSNITKNFHKANHKMVFNEQHNKLLYAFVIIILVYIIAYCTLVSKDSKKISVYKLQGFSDYSITKQLYLPTMLLSICLYGSTTFLWLTMITTFDVIYYDFFRIIIKYYLLFIISEPIIFVLICLYIRLTCHSLHLGKINQLDKIIKINYILKIIIGLSMLETFSYTIFQSIPMINHYSNMNQYKNIIENCQRLDSIPQTDINDLGEQLMNIGYYSDFETYNVYSDVNNSLIYNDGHLNKEVYMSCPYISVNNQYVQIMNNEIRDINNNQLDISKMNNNTLLVPITYKNNDLKPYLNQIIGEKEIIYVQNTGKYINLDVRTTLLELNNPIVRVVNHFDWNIISIFDLYLPINDIYTQQYYTHLLQQYNLTTQDLGFIKTNHYYTYYIEQLSIALRDMIGLICLYSFVFGLFLYQSTSIYIIKNKKKLAMLYTLGVSKFNRYKDLLLQNMSLYLLICILSILIVGNSLNDTLLFVGIFMTIEFVIQVLLLIVFEKKNINNILKGE